MKIYSIAIDGPAGAGKSTIAKNLAKKMGFIYVDTGAMYRAIGLYYSRLGIASDDIESIEKHLNNIDISITYENGEQQVILNGENVNAFIRDSNASKMASAISVHKPVRIKLVELQRTLAKQTSVVMDGRDIGSYVLPDATLKIYLNASVEIRAKRRYDEMAQKGEILDFEVLKDEIRKRDEQDMNRPFAPLVKAQDAIEIDSSDMTIDEVTNAILQYFEERK